MSVTSFEYYYSLNEAAPIEIDQINNLKDDKLFVSVGGGIGTGKTFLTNKFVELPVIDVDDFVKDVGGGKYDRSNLSKGRKKFNEKISQSLKGDESFIHMGTNANLNGAKKRLLEAKENGFTTVLVLIDTNPEVAIKQSQYRFEKGERNQISEKRIRQSCEDAFKVFESLIKDNKLVDFYVHVKK